jgi:hypothetical protein
MKFTRNLQRIYQLAATGARQATALNARNDQSHNASSKQRGQHGVAPKVGGRQLNSRVASAAIEIQVSWLLWQQLRHKEQRIRAGHRQAIIIRAGIDRAKFVRGANELAKGEALIRCTRKQNTFKKETASANR